MQYLRDSSKRTHAVVQGIERVLRRSLTQPLNLPDAPSVPDTGPLLLSPGLLSVVRSRTPIDCHRSERTTARARPTDPAGRSRRHDGSIATLVHRVRTRRCYTGPTLPVHLVAWVLVDLGVWLLVPLHRGRTAPPPSRSTPCLQQVHLPRAGRVVEGWFRWHHDGIDMFDTGLDAPPPFTDCEWWTLRPSPGSS